MENNKEIKRLPSDWNERIHIARVCWFVENYGTDEDDENGHLIYDVESMPEDVLEAYKETIEQPKELKKQGIFLD